MRRENELVVSRLRWLVGEQQLRPEDILVLALARRRVEELADAVSAAGMHGQTRCPPRPTPDNNMTLYSPGCRLPYLPDIGPSSGGGVSLSKFVTNMQEGGRVCVPHPSSAIDERGAAEAAIREVDIQSRLELACDAPPLQLPVSLWAASILYEACQFLVYREIGREVVEPALARPCPERLSPATCYSADLLLRHLPQVVSLARGIAEGDPLVTGLLNLARQWPLSSVGIRGIDTADTEPFIHDPCLRRLYADRIIERGDTGRLRDAQARQVVREDLGLHPALAPAIAAALEEHPEHE